MRPQQRQLLLRLPQAERWSSGCGWARCAEVRAEWWLFGLRPSLFLWPLPLWVHSLLVLHQAEDTDLDGLAVIGVADVEQVMATVNLQVRRGENTVYIVLKAQELFEVMAIV